MDVAETLLGFGRGEAARHALQPIGVNETVNPIEFPPLCAVIGRDDHGPDFLGEKILEPALRRGLLPVARVDVAGRSLSETPGKGDHGLDPGTPRAPAPQFFLCFRPDFRPVQRLF